MKASEAPVLDILLAEDDSDDRLFLQEAVAFLNLDTSVTIDTVNDGDELMKTLLSEKGKLPDIVFLDLNMPRKAGLKCLEEIRGNKRLKKLVVVIFTTSTNPKDVDDAYDKGANVYMRKPRKFSELTNMVKKIYQTNWEERQQDHRKEDFVWVH